MSWIDKLKNRISGKNATYAGMLNGMTPIYNQFGQNIYASDVVQQAMKCIVDEFVKLRPLHVKEEGTDIIPVHGDIQSLLNNPNPIMSKADFIEKISYNYLFDLNSFIIPIYYTWKDRAGRLQRKYTAMYPVRPMQVTFIEDAGGTMYVKMEFENNFETIFPYDDIIHWRAQFSVNEYMGGNEFGQADHGPLLKTLQLNNDLLNGISRAAKSTYAVNGIVKYHAMLDTNDTPARLKEFEARLLKSESGILPLDMKADFTPITRDIKLVDNDTLRFIDEKILRHFGVPLCILLGDYTKDQYEAFYQKTLEPKIIKLSEAFSKGLFSQRERNGYNNRIDFYPKDLVFMSTDQTLEMVRLLGDSGALYENEKRRSFGLQPLPELVGVRMQSLNYVNVDIAANYQLQEKKKESENNG
ncbi:MAG: phage portal protein [Clostridiales Family XIII bacterium]|nr:phage portal protein [Clostridia bacterium]MDY3011754.1 phage portal protein [Clostridiales Family XIII bacterium]